MVTIKPGLLRSLALGHGGYTPGGHYALGQGIVTTTVAPGAVDRLLIYPFVVPRPLRLSSLYVRVVTAGAAGSAVKIGVWRNGDAKPVGSPVVVNNSGVATDVTGIRALPVTGELTPGLWWAGTKFGVAVATCVAWHGSFMDFSAVVGALTPEAAIQAGSTTQSVARWWQVLPYGDDMPDLSAINLFDSAGGALGCPVVGCTVAGP